jgi:hypothetical protein
MADDGVEDSPGSLGDTRGERELLSNREEQCSETRSVRKRVCTVQESLEIT